MGLDSWIQQRNHPLPAWSVLGRPVQGVVSWNMNDTCNYRCSYCSQRNMPDRSGKLEDPEVTLASFSQLEGHWEIKLSGGEPFQQTGLGPTGAGIGQEGTQHFDSDQFFGVASETAILLWKPRGGL